MKILLALDGSGPSNLGLDLATSVDWPSGSIVRVVAVDEPEVDVGTVPWVADQVPARPAPRFGDAEALGRLVSEAARRLSGAGSVAETAVPEGWAADEIVRIATDWPADLVILGSRGQGAVASALLGSVSAHVVDHAPCPVLVARRGTAHRIVVGVDGDAPAREAVEYIAHHRLFGQARVEVVGAIGSRVPVGAFAPETRVETDLWVEQLDEARRQAESATEEAAVRLTAAGRIVGVTVRDGDAGRVLLDVAERMAADLVVIGTHGRHGLDRVIHGSVARHLLMHAPTSVLTVRWLRQATKRSGAGARAGQAGVGSRS